MTSLGQLAWTDTGIHTTDLRFYTNYNGPGVPPQFQFPQAVPAGGGLTPDQIGGETFLARGRELPSGYSLRASYIWHELVPPDEYDRHQSGPFE